MVLVLVLVNLQKKLFRQEPLYLTPLEKNHKKGTNMNIMFKAHTFLSVFFMSISFHQEICYLHSERKKQHISNMFLFSVKIELVWKVVDRENQYFQRHFRDGAYQKRFRVQMKGVDR